MSCFAAPLSFKQRIQTAEGILNGLGEERAKDIDFTAINATLSATINALLHDDLAQFRTAATFRRLSQQLAELLDQNEEYEDKFANLMIDKWFGFDLNGHLKTFFDNILHETHTQFRRELEFTVTADNSHVSCVCTRYEYVDGTEEHILELTRNETHASATDCDGYLFCLFDEQDTLSVQRHPNFQSALAHLKQLADADATTASV